MPSSEGKSESRLPPWADAWPPARRRVLAAWARLCDENGNAIAGRTALAREARASVATVDLATKMAVGAGLVKRDLVPTVRSQTIGVAQIADAEWRAQLGLPADLSWPGRCDVGDVARVMMAFAANTCGPTGRCRIVIEGGDYLSLEGRSDWSRWRARLAASEISADAAMAGLREAAAAGFIALSVEPRGGRRRFVRVRIVDAAWLGCIARATATRRLGPWHR